MTVVGKTTVGGADKAWIHILLEHRREPILRLGRVRRLLCLACLL